MHAVTVQVPSWSFWGSSFLESWPCDVPSPENNDKRLAKVHWIPIQRCVSKVLVEGIKSLLVLNNSQEFFQCIQLPLRYLHVLLGVHPFWVKNPVILAHLKVKKGINSEFSLYKWSCSRLEQCRRRCMGESAKTIINRDFPAHSCRQLNHAQAAKIADRRRKIKTQRRNWNGPKNTRFQS